MVNGRQIGPTPGGVHEGKHNGTSFSLITDMTDNMSHGFYKCGVGTNEAEEKYLKVECKPDNALVSRTQNQHLEILLTDVFPIPKISLTLKDAALQTVALDFQHYCGGMRWTITCKWTSTTPLPLVDCRVWLEAPKIANCRGDTVLTCHYCDTPLTTRTWSRKIGDVWEVIMENGTQIYPSQRLMIKEEINGWFSLIISGADNMAAGIYRCGVDGYQSAGVEFQVECKPEVVEVRLTAEMRIELKMNTVFPVPDIHFMLTDAAKQTTSVLFGFPLCSGHSWLQDCVWISTSTFPTSKYTYELVAKTMTETYFTGNLA